MWKKVAPVGKTAKVTCCVGLFRQGESPKNVKLSKLRFHRVRRLNRLAAPALRICNPGPQDCTNGQVPCKLMLDRQRTDGNHCGPKWGKLATCGL